MDYLVKKELPVDQSKVAQLENWWDKTMFGMIEKKLDSKAKKERLVELQNH